MYEARIDRGELPFGSIMEQGGEYLYGLDMGVTQLNIASTIDVIDLN
jgi:hypothetical protein